MERSIQRAISPTCLFCTETLNRCGTRLELERPIEPHPGSGDTQDRYRLPDSWADLHMKVTDLIGRSIFDTDSRGFRRSKSDRRNSRVLLTDRHESRGDFGRKIDALTRVKISLAFGLLN